MEDDEKQPRRGGRLRKSPAGERRQTFTFRLSGDVKDALLAAADRSGRSLSEELEQRIESSLRSDKRAAFEDALLRGGKNTAIVRHIAAVLTMFEIADGKEEYGLEYAFYTNAISEILRNTLPTNPPHLIPEPVSPERSVLLERAERRGREIGQFVLRETFLDTLMATPPVGGEEPNVVRASKMAEPGGVVEKE